MVKKDKTTEVSKDEPKEEEVKMVSYQLVRDYWDNRRKHTKGAVLDFPEGKAPRDSIELTSRKAKELRGRVAEALLDPMEVELERLRDRLAALEAPAE